MTKTKWIDDRGIDGSGNKVWAVITADEKGNYIWIESFDNQAEAINWLKYIA